MSQTRRLYDLFKAHGFVLTNRQIQEAHFTLNHTGRLSDLRDEGFKIDWIKAENPMDHKYTVTNPEHFPEKWRESIPVGTEPGGQMAWGFVQGI